MANPMKDKGVIIELDRKRTLKYDFNAFVELEERYGDIDEAFNAVEAGKLKDIRATLYIGLMHEDEELTEKQVGSFFSLAEISMIASKLSEALKLAMPESEVEDEEPDEKAKKEDKKQDGKK